MVQRIPDGGPFLGPGTGQHALDLFKDKVLRLCRVWNLTKDHVSTLAGRLDDQIAKVLYL